MWDDVDASLMRAVDGLVEHGSISDDTWTVLRTHLDNQQILDVIFTAGAYTTVAWMVESLGIALDDDLGDGSESPPCPPRDTSIGEVRVVRQRSGSLRYVRDTSAAVHQPLCLEVRTTAANRRLGAEATQDELLDAVEHVLFESGQANVQSTALWQRQAAVTPSLVQYYFPTIDDLFAAMIRRSDRPPNRPMEQRAAAPSRRAAARALGIQPGRSRRGAGNGDHRTGRPPTRRSSPKSPRNRTHSRNCNSEALAKRSTATSPSSAVPSRRTPWCSLVTSIPKMLSLEETVHVGLAHRQLIEAFEGYLDSVEPKSRARRTKAPTPTRRRSHS